MVNIPKQKLPKVSIKQWTKKLDKLAGDLVRGRGKCERCGRTDRLQWAHIVSRRAKRIRWDLDNAFCLCQNCHFMFTNNPEKWPLFVDQLLGEGKYMELHRRANDFSYKVDHEAIFNNLKEIDL